MSWTNSNIFCHAQAHAQAHAQVHAHFLFVETADQGLFLRLQEIMIEFIQSVCIVSYF